jgi:hypothetical protein
VGNGHCVYGSFGPGYRRKAREAVTDKGYHNNDTLQALVEAEVRTYISEPGRGRRRWRDKLKA